mmetsp:Transcript_11437/g.11447  ORF Transcript_11437/g.11447 Transcript_11437/m.11447 type:complete len:94 (+) Transcript_11437:182-463(+)
MYELNPDGSEAEYVVFYHMDSTNNRAKQIVFQDVAMEEPVSFVLVDYGQSFVLRADRPEEGEKGFCTKTIFEGTELTIKESLKKFWDPSSLNH